MKLCTPYPNSVEMNGRTWRLDLSLHRVLEAIDAQEREEMTAADRAQLQCAWLLDPAEELPEDPTLCARIVSAAFELFPKPEQAQTEKVLDFEQDAALIRSAFLRLGIDLTAQDIHFFKFLELLADLPSDTALMRVVEIRRAPIPEINQHNREQVVKLLEAKQKVALKKTDKERRESFQRQLTNSPILWR